jgi:hypothetical protein
MMDIDSERNIAASIGKICDQCMYSETCDLYHKAKKAGYRMNYCKDFHQILGL